MPKFVWVVDSYLGCRFPTIKRYVLVQVQAHSVRVKIRGSTTYVREAQSRKFFTDEQKFWDYIRGWLATSLHNAHGRVRDYTEAFRKCTVGDKTAVEIDEIPDEGKPKPE